MPGAPIPEEDPTLLVAMDALAPCCPAVAPTVLWLELEPEIEVDSPEVAPCERRSLDELPWLD